MPRHEYQEAKKRVTIPNGEHMATTETLKLPLPDIPVAARTAHRMPGITNNLLSAPVLCDAGCTVTFSKNDVTVMKEKKLILQGWRDPHNRLWRVPLHNENKCEAATVVNNVYECDSEEELIRFYHATCFSPRKSTWIQAIKKGYFRGWPGLEAKKVNRYINIDEATEKGHMSQTRQNVRSTKKRTNGEIPQKNEMSYEDINVKQEEPNERTNDVFIALEDVTGKVYSDQTGKFPRTSSRGMKYIMVFYVYDANYVCGIPLKNRTAEEFLRAYKQMYTTLQSKGYAPRLHKLDNETSRSIEEFIESQGTKIQFATPHIHRQNAAERGIQTWKNHFIAGLASVHPEFPIAYWCRLVEQCNVTLNLLRTCRMNNALSAQASLFGDFHFDHTPMAPPGTDTLAHVKPCVRETYGYHSQEAWYVGPAVKHYRCYRAISKKTGAEIISDTVKFRHHHIKVPRITPLERLTHATNELAKAIGNVPQSPRPNHVDAVERVRRLLLPVLTNSPSEGGKSGISQVHENAKVSKIGEIEKFTTPQPQRNKKVTIARNNPTTPTMSAQPTIPVISQDEDDVDLHSKENHLTMAPPRTPSPSPTRNHHLRYDNAPKRYELRSRSSHRINSVIIEEPANVKSYKLPNIHDTDVHTPVASDPPCFYDNTIPPYFANAIIDPETGDALEYHQLIKRDEYKQRWMASFTKELQQLAQGNNDIKGTDTIFFIPKHQVPTGRKVTYGRIVVDYRPQKADPYRTRLTVGGDRLEYPWDKSTPTAGLVTSKLLFNSVVSTPRAKFMGIDIKHFYLCTPLDRFEYMRLPLRIIPDAIIEQYKLKELAQDGWVYIEIRKGMYGLPQAGILANKLLVKRLDKFGYAPVRYTPGLWRHKWRPIMFSLVVDDFGVKYTGAEHAEHLIKALQSHYQLSVDWTGGMFCGITLKWDYEKRTVDLSMLGYIQKALLKFQHPTPTVPVDAPHKHTPIKYGAQPQMVPIDMSPKLSPTDITRVQNIVGTLLYYSRAVDSTLATALSTIASQQANATEATMKACNQLLDYVATHPNAVLRYSASDMILAVHSDASYLSEAKARSRAGGHVYLTNTNDENFRNGAVLTVSTIIKHVMASASEAELAAMFYNSREAIPLRITLAEMGHKQPPTTMTVDNSTAHGLTEGAMIPKRSKAMDM